MVNKNVKISADVLMEHINSEENTVEFIVADLSFKDILGFSLDEYNAMVDEIVEEGYLLSNISYRFCEPFHSDYGWVSLKVTANTEKWEKWFKEKDLYYT